MSTNPNIPTPATDSTLSCSFVPRRTNGAAKTSKPSDQPIDAQGTCAKKDMAGARRNPTKGKKTRASSCMSSPATAALKQINGLDATSIVEKDFTDAEELKQAYGETHAEIIRAGKAGIVANQELILALGKMRAILSQRGKEKLKKQAGIKWTGWEHYFREYKKKYGLKDCLRTVINKIDELAGKKLCTECKKAGGHLPSCSRHPQPIPHLNNSARRALIDGNHRAVEIVTSLEAGRDPKEEVAAFKAVMNAKRLNDILDAAESEAAAKATKEFSWENLIDRLEILLPTVEDGNEHVIVDKLETGILRVQAGEKADPRVALLCQRIGANFTAYAQLLDPTAVADHPDVLNAEKILRQRLNQLEQEQFCAEVV